MARVLKSIDVDPDAYDAFRKLAKSYKLTNKDLFGAMVQYFNATKADPRDPKADNPTDAIKALDKRLIGFIREQEKKILRPLSDDMQVLLTLLKEDLPARLGQSHMRTVGTAIRPEFLNTWFVEALLKMQTPPAPTSNPPKAK